MTACGDDGSAKHQVSFRGAVYDVATGQKLAKEAFEITLRAKGGEKPCKVEEDGSYLCGSISAFDDYAVRIQATGYRPFVSYNAQVGLPEDLRDADSFLKEGTDRLLYYDAYLSPSTLVVPELSIEVVAPGSAAATSGSAKLSPVALSSLLDDAVDVLPSVETQVWDNDEDLLGARVALEFSGGRITIPEGRLLAGVPYKVSIFNVAGFAPFEQDFSSSEGPFTMRLTPQAALPVELVGFVPDAANTPSANGALDIQFNQAIALIDPSGAASAIDANFTISGAVNGVGTALSLAAPGQRGTSISVEGTTLRLRWSNLPANYTGGVAPTSGPTSVRWGGLSSIAIAPASRPNESTLLGSLGLTGRTVVLP